MLTFLRTSLFLLFALGLSTVSLAQEMAHKEASSGHESMLAESADKTGPTLVSLSQVPGQYETTSLELAAGTYVFEVTNRNVDKDLGFYLQAADDSQVANSGLKELVGKGESSRSGTVTLTPGTYHYSCPLNPTPHYTITVQ